MACKQAMETVSPDLPKMVEAAARVGLPINDEAQKAAIEYELANVTWLGLLLQKKLEPRGHARLVTPATRLAVDAMKDTPRINLLRKGARWLYERNDEKAFVKLWDMASVPFEMPEEGPWQDFIMQWVMRVFNNVVDLADIPKRPVPAEIRIENVTRKVVGRLFADLPHLPERDRKDLLTSVGEPFAAQLRGRVK